MKALAIDINNLPTPKNEAWKYTNLPRAVPEGLRADAASQVEVIYIPRGQISGQVRDILFTGTPDTLHSPSLKVVLEDGVQLTLLERHEGTGAYWKNMICEIELGAGAILNHVRLLDDSVQALTTINMTVNQARDSSYNLFSMMHGAAMTRNEVGVFLNGAGASCDLSGVKLLKGKQHGDTTIKVEHAAPHCTSSQFFRSILAGESRGVFQGKIHVHRIAQKTDGYQLSNALLLSDKAEMDVKPELEIYADDVKCSHGSTVGQLDETALFYLRSRGLNAAQARLLLVEAFVHEVVDKIADEGLKARVQGLCRAWLAGVL